jgi:hypothetical protein
VTQPLRWNGAQVDLSPRFFQSSTVAASPSAAAETVVCQIAAIVPDAAVVSGVFLTGAVNFTVGTNGTAIRVRIRQTGVAGTVIADTGAITGGVAAANLLSQDIQGFDTAAVIPGQVYVLTLQVTAGSAASTVSSANLAALII